jgi:hypothetical protein
MINLRIPHDLWQELITGLLQRRDVETAGILLAERLSTDEGVILIVRRIAVWPEAGYAIREPDRLQLDPVSINRLTRPARDRGLSIITIHTHPGCSEAWFSAADDAGDAHLMPSFRMQIPAVPHGSMVLTGGGHVIARLFDERSHPMPMVVTIVGDRVRRLEAGGHPDDERFSRQVLALGKDGQQQIRSLRFGVIGLGGIGSMVFAQLAHLGAGEIVAMDGDVVETTNFSRIVGVRPADAGRTMKVDVACRYASEAGFPSKVLVHPQHLASEQELQILRACDIIISCVDRYTPRALLNRLSYEAAVPAIDLGTAFQVDETGVMVGDAGRVVVIGPGKPCLACWGHLDADALRLEALSERERQSLAAEGYVSGANIQQPSVIPFNTMVAGAGMIEVLRLVTGFSGMSAPPKRLAFSFKDGTVRRNGLVGDQRCSICGQAAPQAAA